MLATSEMDKKIIAVLLIFKGKNIFIIIKTLIRKRERERENIRLIKTPVIRSQFIEL